MSSSAVLDKFYQHVRGVLRIKEDNSFSLSIAGYSRWQWLYSLCGQAPEFLIEIVCFQTHVVQTFTVFGDERAYRVG